jgi:integrase
LCDWWTRCNRADGRWEGRLELARESGKRRRKAVYGRTRNEVVDKLRKQRAQLDSGLPLPDELATGDYLRSWAADVLPGTVKDSTVYGYKSVVEGNVIPYVGHVKLAKLAPTHVHRMMRKLEERGLAAQTRRTARMVLRRALSYAERWGVVVRNVAALIDSPRGSDPKRDDALDVNEVQALFGAARSHRLDALVKLAVMVGLRRGEVLGLRWEDVDLDAGTVSIHATLKRLPGRGLVLDRPKTERAARTVALPEICTRALSEHRRRQLEERLAAGSHWQNSGHVFTTPFGGPIDPDNLVKRDYHGITAAAGLGKLRFHALRHTAATLMLAEGVPLEVISRTFGHAGYAITATCTPMWGRRCSGRLPKRSTVRSEPDEQPCDHRDDHLGRGHQRAPGVLRSRLSRADARPRKRADMPSFIWGTEGRGFESRQPDRCDVARHRRLMSRVIVDIRVFGGW